MINLIQRVLISSRSFIQVLLLLLLLMYKIIGILALTLRIYFNLPAIVINCQTIMWDSTISQLIILHLLQVYSSISNMNLIIFHFL